MPSRLVESAPARQSSVPMHREFSPGLILLLVLSLGCAVQPEPPEVILTGGNLLDGTGAPVQSRVDIHIQGGRIAAIAESGARPVPAGAAVVDVRGKWILPGLIDSHVHYREWMAEFFLYHGVTSVFDLGNRIGILETKNAVRSGRPAGPRLFSTGPGLQGPFPDDSAPGWEQNPIRYTVRSAEEAAARATRLLDQGAAAIKVREWMPPEWIRAVGKVAHARDKPVVGHLTSPVHAAVGADLDALIHPYGIGLSTLSDPAELEFIRKTMILQAKRKEYPAYYLLQPPRFQPLIDVMVSEGVFFNPTFGSQFRGIYDRREEFDRYDSAFLDLHARELGYLTPNVKQRLLPFFGSLSRYPVNQPMRAKLEAGMGNVAEFMRRFSRAGGKMAAGTDTSASSGGIPGVRLHRELQLWVDLGVAPMEAIRGATQYPAQLFRLTDLGTVEVGKQADLIVLAGNPLQDIRLLGAVDRVFLAGEPVPRELHPASLTGLLQQP